jgi:hypothetical protein
MYSMFFLKDAGLRGSTSIVIYIYRSEVSTGQDVRSSCRPVLSCPVLQDNISIFVLSCPLHRTRESERQAGQEKSVRAAGRTGRTFAVLCFDMKFVYKLFLITSKNFLS